MMTWLKKCILNETKHANFYLTFKLPWSLGEQNHYFYGNDLFPMESEMSYLFYQVLSSLCFTRIISRLLLLSACLLPVTILNPCTIEANFWLWFCPYGKSGSGNLSRILFKNKRQQPLIFYRSTVSAQVMLVLVSSQRKCRRCVQVSYHLWQRKRATT